MASIIIMNSNQCELDIPLKFANMLYEEMSIRHPNAFYLKRSQPKWDGKIHFINKNGYFKIGFLSRIYQRCIELGVKNLKVIDNRREFKSVKPKVIKHIGKYELRKEQVQAISSILNSKVGNIPFYIGVTDLTVNFGKSLLMAALYYAFGKKLKTLLITNDADWLRQAKEEFKQYLPDETVTYVQGSKVNNWSNFSIGMIQSLSRNIRVYQRELTTIDMVLVDEADQAGSKSYQSVLSHMYNTKVRIGLSGTIYMSKLKKDQLKNMNLESFFGQVLTQFKLKDSIKKGYSTNVVVKLVPFNKWFGNWESEEIGYMGEYDSTITNNRNAWDMVYDRLIFNMAYGRLPALVVCKYIKHCENLYKYIKKKLEDRGLTISCVHVDTPTKLRKKIVSDFREGKIDILFSTTILSRGKNFPLLKYMINAASMDSQEKSIQFLGRLVRTHVSKKKAVLDDLQYPGYYLSRHGKHRKRYYQNEGLKVIQL